MTLSDPSAFETAAISLSANLPLKLVVPVGYAPTTSSMSRKHSTTELRDRSGNGFSFDYKSKFYWFAVAFPNWRKMKDSNLRADFSTHCFPSRTHKPLAQSSIVLYPFAHCCIYRMNNLLIYSTDARVSRLDQIRFRSIV